jgi:cysteine desulfurase
MEQGALSALLFHSSSVAQIADSAPTFGNPSSIHSAGRAAKAAVDQARDALAAALGLGDPDSICFTGSATESINTALKGFFFYHQKEGRKVHFLSSVVEHEATLESLRFLEEMGAKVELLPVNSRGELSLEALKKSLDAIPSDAAKMVTLLAANNETGVVFPWEEAARIANASGASFHLDGVQALGKLPGFSLKNQPVDFASFSAHKMGGPKGVGALVVRKGAKISSFVHGGAQERKRRAGTVNVAGIAAFGAAAAALADRDLTRVDRMRAGLEAQVKERIPGAGVQGAGAARLVNTSNFLFDGVRGEGLVMGLDLEGFAVSSGSACNSGSILPSHVLLAMGLDKLAAQSAIRVSLSPHNSEEELKLFVDALERVVGRIRSLAHK